MYICLLLLPYQVTLKINNPQNIYKNIISLLENKSASEKNLLVSLPGDYNEHRVIQYTYNTTFKS